MEGQERKGWETERDNLYVWLGGKLILFLDNNFKEKRKGKKGKEREEREGKEGKGKKGRKMKEK